MPGLRRARSYSKKRVVPFTRVSKKRQKSYIKTVPQQKIVKFSMGSEQLFAKGKLPHQLTMVTTEPVQVRHNAFEACRQYVNKQLETTLVTNYLFKVIPFSHHIQRENKMLTGAGADRMQTGMQLAYGRPMGKAAILKKGGKLFFVAVPTAKDVVLVRKLFKQIKSKLPCKTRVDYELKK